MIISRKFQFDAAHMLSRYEGKCSNLHGHTYTGEVELVGEVRDNGMLIDYNEIKEIIGRFDHAIIFSGRDIQNTAESALFSWASLYNMKIFLMEPGRKCTAENISREIAECLEAVAGKDVAIRVELHETPDSTAVYNNFTLENI